MTPHPGKAVCGYFEELIRNSRSGFPGASFEIPPCPPLRKGGRKEASCLISGHPALFSDTGWFYADVIFLQ